MARHKIDQGGGAADVEGEEGEPKPELMTAAESLISAVHSKDAKAVAEALEAAMAILDNDDMSSEEEG